MLILCLSYFITSVNSNTGKSMSFSPKVWRIIAILGKEKNDEALFPTLWCFEFTHCTGNQHFRECTKACFIYILDSSFSTSSKFWSINFPSSSICSSNDNWNDWTVSFEITFHCIAKQIRILGFWHVTHYSIQLFFTPHPNSPGALILNRL